MSYFKGAIYCSIFANGELIRKQNCHQMWDVFDFKQVGLREYPLQVRSQLGVTALPALPLPSVQQSAAEPRHKENCERRIFAFRETTFQVLPIFGTLA